MSCQVFQPLAVFRLFDPAKLITEKIKMKSNLYALRQRKVDLRKQSERLLALAKNEGRDLSMSELAQHEKNLAALSTNEAALIEAESQLETERRMPALEDEDSLFAAAALGGGYPSNAGRHHVERKPRGRVGIKTLAQLFDDSPKAGNTGGFRSLGEFVRAVNFSQQVFDPRLQASMTEGVPSQAGFLVPEQWAQTILQQALEDAIVMPRAQMWPMTSDVIKIPGVKDTDHSSSVLYGGVSANWSNELGTLADANVKTRLIELSAKKLGMLSLASSELAEDSNFESVLTAKLQEGAQWHLDNAFLFGDGTGKPQGMLNAANPSLLTITHNTATPADSVIYEDSLALFAAMAPRCRQRATWSVNDAHIPALMLFQLKVRNQANSDWVGGSATPLFKMNDDGSGVLLGRPVIFTEKAAAVGELGDFAFCDISSYAVGLRREIRLERSVHAGFASDGVYWRLTCRCDGQSTWESSLKLKNGASVSPFVQLSAR